MSDLTSQQKAASGARFEFMVALSLILAILFIYYQTRSFDFVLLDDDVYILNNPYTSRGLSSENVKWAFSSSHGGFWIPLTWLTYMVDSQLHGLDAGYYHMTNLIFHILNTLLLFAVFRQMTGDIWRSGFVAALFAVHPVHVESVAWVSERKDLLFAFFWLLTMWRYHHYAKQPCIRRYSVVALFFAAGLMSKPMMVTLPCALLLCDYWPLRRLQFNRDPHSDGAYPKVSLIRAVLEKVPLIILSIAASTLTFVQQHAHGAVSSIDNTPLSLRMANVLVSYMKYMANLLWPHDLTAIYPYPAAIPIWQTAGALLLLGFISFLAIKHWARHPYFAMGWLWFLGTLVPVIGIVKFGSHAMADRYTYVTFIGLYIMIAWGGGQLLSRCPYKKMVFVSVAAAIIAVLGITAKVQASYWRNSIQLFQHAVEVTRDNFLAHRNLGLALSYHGKLDEALGHFKKALRIRPTSARCYNDIGTYFMIKGRYDESIGYFKNALQLRPNFPKAHNNLGLVLMAQGKYEDAASHFESALESDPDFKPARRNLKKAITSLAQKE